MSFQFHLLLGSINRLELTKPIRLQIFEARALQSYQTNFKPVALSKLAENEQVKLSTQIKVKTTELNPLSVMKAEGASSQQIGYYSN